MATTAAHPPTFRRWLAPGMRLVDSLKYRSTNGDLPPPVRTAQRSERVAEAPIRRRLMLLILSIVVPGLVYNTIVTMQVARSDQERLRAKGASVARQITQAFDLVVGRNLLVLEGLARALAEQQSGPEAFEAFEAFEATVRAFAHVTQDRIVLLDPSGRPVFKTFNQFTRNGATAVNPGLIADVMATRAPVVGNYVPASLTGADSGVALAAPVIKRGEVVSIVAGIVDLATLDGVFERLQIDADWAVGSIDRNGVVMARRPHGHKFVGQSANAGFLRAMGASTGGFIDNYVTREGLKSLAVFERSKQTGWTVGLAIPASQLDAPLRSAVFRTAALGMFLLVLSMVLATWGGLLIERPIRRLQSAASCLGRGEAVDLQPTGITELDDAGRAFAEAAAQRAGYEKKLKEATEQLQAAAQRTSMALRAGKMGTFQVDLATDEVVWSDEQLDLIGIEHKPGNTWLGTFGALLHPDDRDAVLERRRSSLGTPGQHEDQYRIVRTDGQTRWVHVYRQVHSGPDGLPNTYSGLCIDITERKRGEEALIASEEFARSVLDGSPDSIKVLDLGGVPVYLNARARAECEADAGGSVAEWSAQCAAEFSADAALAIEAAKRGQKAEFSGSLIAPNGDPRWWDVTVAPVAGPGGDVVRILTISRDVTERKRAEAALISSEAFTRSIVQNTTDCVKVLELDSRIAYMNENGQRAIEVDSFAEVDGQCWIGFWPEDSAPLAARAIESAIAGEHATFTAACPTFMGNWRWWDNTVTPIFDNDGNVARLLAVSRDVSERKRSEERQALLVRELAHRSKNLLAVVQSIALQSLKDVADACARDAFVSRLHTLGRSHAMVAHNVHEGAPLSDVVRRELDAFAGTATVEGPDLIVSRKAAQNLALAVHELATNAAKYGALKSTSGRISVAWRLQGAGDARRFQFVWRERGGPPPAPQASKGFGSLLLDRVVASELRAQTKTDFAPEGLTYEIDAPFAEIAAELTPHDGLIVALAPSYAA